MKQLGLREILNVISLAHIQKDSNLAERLENIVNENIRFDITDEDYQYIVDNYAK
jgi:hypothetical protein